MSRFGGDYRQNVVLALQAQGDDALTRVRDALQEVSNKLAVLEQQYDGTNSAGYVRTVQALGKELQNLQKLELGLIQTSEEATRARIDGYARQERAAQQLAEAEAQAAGDALRVRIDAYARIERAAEQAAAAERQAAGDALRARIEAYAREESAAAAAAARVNQLVSAEVQGAGDVKRARIDAYAEIDARAEASYRAKNEAVRQQIADEAALRAALGQAEQRKHDLAAEEAYEQQLRDQAALHEHLGRLEREAGEAAEQGQARASAARRAGTAAIDAQIKAIEEARVASDRAAANAQKNASSATWVTKQEADLKDLIQELAVYEARADALTASELRNYQVIATAATKAGVAVKNSHEESLRSARGTTQAVLEVSRGLEDFATGGFVGILNNIPGAIQGIGQAAGLSTLAVGGLTAGISVLATGAFVLWKNWDQVQELFGLGIPRPILDTTEELKRKLKEAKDVTEDLGKKTNLTLAELNQYKDATGKVKEYNAELKRRADLEDILSGKSKAERERASGFKEAVAETGGEEAVRALEGAIDPYAVGGKVFNEVRGKNSSSRDLAEDLIREAGGGDKRLRDKIVELLRGQYGSKEGDFASRIEATSPETKAAAKAQEDADKLRVKATAEFTKVIEDNAKAEAKAEADATKTRLKVQGEFTKVIDDNAKQVAAGRKKALADAAQTYGPGIENALQDTFTRRIAVGQTPQRAGDALLPQVRDRLREVGAPADLIDDLAAQILEKATDKASNDIQKLSLERGIAPRQAAQNLRLTDVRKVAGAQGREQRFNNERQVAGRFQQVGFNPGEAEDAARRVGGLVQKGRDPAQAMQQVYQEMRKAMAQILAGQEAQAGFAGQATREMAIIGAQAQRLRMNVQGQARQLNRNVQRRKTLLTN